MNKLITTIVLAATMNSAFATPKMNCDLFAAAATHVQKGRQDYKKAHSKELTRLKLDASLREVSGDTVAYAYLHASMPFVFKFPTSTSLDTIATKAYPACEAANLLID